MNLKFGWIKNSSVLETISHNITEYTTVELLSRNIDVCFFQSLEDALCSDLNFYAVVGTLFDDSVYDLITQDTKNFDINSSEFVKLNGANLYNDIPLINWGLSHQNYFTINTEKFETTYLRNDDTFDCCVCSAGGITAKLILENVNLSPNAKIFVVDISKNSLDLCKERIGNNFEFVYLDLFDTVSVKKFAESISGNKALWFASNIFNYVNTSLIYSVDVRRKKQQDFIEALASQQVDWYVSMNTADSEIIKNKSVKDLILINRDIKFLPWVSSNQQS